MNLTSAPNVALIVRYKSSLASDIALLAELRLSSTPQNNNQNQNLQNAVRLRAGEKRVLAHYLELTTTALRLLTAPSPAAASTLLKTCEIECHIMTFAYCISTVVPLLPFRPAVGS